MQEDNIAHDASEVSYVRSETGAVQRTVEDKLEEVVFVTDFDTSGGYKDALDDAIGAAAGQPLGVEGGPHTVHALAIDRAVMLFGRGTITDPNVGGGNCLNIGAAEPKQLLSDVAVTNIAFKDVKTGKNDGLSCVNFVNCKAPVAAFLRFSETPTAVRSSYSTKDGGETIDARTQDALILGCDIENARKMGVEQIRSNYNRIVACSIHSSIDAFDNNNPPNNIDASDNDINPIGMHGIRFSDTEGSIVSATSIRDRASNGISLQAKAKYGVISGAFIKNTKTGIHTTLGDSEQTPPKGFAIDSVVIADSSENGLRLDDLSNTHLSAVVHNSTAENGYTACGARLENKTTGGFGNIGDIVLKTADTGCIIDNDNCNLRLTLDDIQNTGLILNGSYNVITITARDCNKRNLRRCYSVQVFGSHNVIVLADAGTTRTNLIVSGGHNTIIGIVKTVSVNGDNNALYCDILGNLYGSGTNNSFYGRIDGTIDSGILNGAGNSLANVKSVCGSGAVTQSTDAYGDVTVDHDLKLEPQAIAVTGADDQPRIYCVRAKGSANFTVRVFDTSGAAVTNTQVSFYYRAGRN